MAQSNDEELKRLEDLTSASGKAPESPGGSSNDCANGCGSTYIRRCIPLAKFTILIHVWLQVAEVRVWN